MSEHSNYEQRALPNKARGERNSGKIEEEKEVNQLEQFTKLPKIPFFAIKPLELLHVC